MYHEERIASALEHMLSRMDRTACALEHLLTLEEQRRDIERQIAKDLRKYLQHLADPNGFRITETAVQSQGEEAMSKLKAGLDLEILDSGKGVLYTLTPTRDGNPVPLPSGSVITAVSSAPASLTNAVQDPGDPTANPPRSADTTGLVFLATVPQPPVDATGITQTFTDTATNGATLSATADPVDVTADNSPNGFTITESAA